MLLPFVLVVAGSRSLNLYSEASAARCRGRTDVAVEGSASGLEEQTITSTGLRDR